MDLCTRSSGRISAPIRGHETAADRSQGHGKRWRAGERETGGNGEGKHRAARPPTHTHTYIGSLHSFERSS